MRRGRPPKNAAAAADAEVVFKKVLLEMCFMKKLLKCKMSVPNTLSSN